MNINEWNKIQIHAESCLPTGFARRVVVQAARVHAQMRRERWVALTTAFVLGVSIMMQHWIATASEHHQNLAQWRVVEQQIEALETTL